MLTRIDNTQRPIAEKIHALFQRSYKIEAELVGAEQFPPLLWDVAYLMQRPSEFWALLRDDTMPGLIEVREKSPEHIHICSLVVDPDFFRQGLATQMIQFAFDHYPHTLITVETAAANQPAITLYKKMGFALVRTYEAEFGIAKVVMELGR